jgi:transketolase N-terminal domain/subunit
MNPLYYRILELSYKYKLSHIGSCLGTVGILDEIYSMRKPNEPVIVSCGHAGLALYVILEKYAGKNAEELLNKYGCHLTKNINDGIHCSAGSLGQGITIAVGHALADRKRSVYCIISDGEMAEGAVYEALNFAARIELKNLKIHALLNGYGCCHAINPYLKADDLQHMLWWAIPRIKSIESLGIPFIKGQEAHYHIMTEEDWKWTEANK